MSELKPGDRCWVQGYLAEWSGGMWTVSGIKNEAEAAIPDSPHLAAVARVLVAHPFLTKAIEMAYVDSVERGDRTELTDAIRALAAALGGES